VAEPHHTDERPFPRALADGRAIQAAIAAGEATRAQRLDIPRIRAVGARHRVFSALRLDEAQRELVAADHRFGSALRSPVDGLFVTIKGNIPRRGMPWTEGSRAYRDRIAEGTAAAVLRLEDAGAVTIGCTTLTELAMYAPDNPFEPVALNPYAPHRTPGGSSAGAGVAAALGLAEINLGTDAGGSIRNPAIHCGVVGFKPSLDRWSLDGVTRYAPDLDTLGVACRSVEDVVAVDAVLSQPGASAPPTHPLRLRVPERLLASCDAATRRLFDVALRSLEESGLPVDTITIESWAAGEAAAGIVSRFQGARRVDPALRGRLSSGLADRLALADAIGEGEAEAARAACAALADELATRLAPGDVVVTPGWPFRAPRIRQTHVVVAGRRLPMDPARNVFVRAANAARAPALVLPAGFYPGCVPFGLQLMAEEGADARVLEAGRVVAGVLSPGIGDAASGTRGDDGSRG
jgi:Asp-tRNA(Asn)/Glu-tRNA(Gln) amidotransferase A subunit family amidase